MNDANLLFELSSVSSQPLDAADKSRRIALIDDLSPNCRITLELVRRHTKKLVSVSKNIHDAKVSIGGKNDDITVSGEPLIPLY
jgi:hypothetical protein